MISSRITDILDSAGIPYRETKYVSPPKDTYIAVFDSKTAVGPDCAPNMLIQHAVTLEMYSYKIDAAAEAALEAAMCGAEMEWTKSDREWIEQEKLYQTVYNFSFLSKED